MEALFKAIGIKPKNLNLYKQAFTHKTYANENRKEKHYEMLEFVGDSLIQYKSSLFIYKKFPKKNEGDASILRSQTVNTEALSELALELKLNSYMRISKGAKEILENKKVNADLFESLSAAIFIDLGDEELDKFLNKTLYKYILSKNEVLEKDPKSKFQEIVQSFSKKTVEYKIFKKDTNFIAELHFDGKIYGIGEGRTKKEAEVYAAKNALLLFQEGRE